MKFVILNLKSIGPLKVNLDTRNLNLQLNFYTIKNKPYKLNNKDDVQRITEALNGDQFEITNVNRKEKHVILLIHLLHQPYNKKLHVN